MKKPFRTPGVLVCVTDQFACERLILTGSALASAMEVPLQVLSVQPETMNAKKRGEALEYLYDIAAHNNAEMTIYYHDDCALMAAGHIKKYGIRHVVTGRPPASDLIDGNPSINFIDVLRTLCPEVTITMVSPDGKTHTLMPRYEVASKACMGTA